MDLSLLEVYIEAIRVEVREANSPLYDSGVDVYERFVRQALRKYSVDKPFIKVASITGTGSEYLTINSSNMPSFVDHWSVVQSIEAKAPTISSNDDPNFIDRDQWDFYRNSDNLFIKFKEHKPSSSDTIMVTYTIPHTINKLDGDTVDTVPSIDFEAIVLWASSVAAKSLASKFAGTSDPTLRADVVNYKTKSSDYLRISKEYRDAYIEWISDPIKAASIVRDIDFGFGFGDNQPFMTHRSFSNR